MNSSLLNFISIEFDPRGKCNYARHINSQQHPAERAPVFFAFAPARYLEIISSRSFLELAGSTGKKRVCSYSRVANSFRCYPRQRNCVFFREDGQASLSSIFLKRGVVGIEKVNEVMEYRSVER